MPKIQISKPLFYSLLGYQPSFKELEQQLTSAKAEIDEEDSEATEDSSFTIELNDTNRPDLWSLAGLSRLLRTYGNTADHAIDENAGKSTDKSVGHIEANAEGETTANKEANTYTFFHDDPHPIKEIIVDSALQDMRPFVLGFIISGKKIDNTLLIELIQTQEKLCDNFGQHRAGISIGIYREPLISWPVYYIAADPQTTAFIPLDYSRCTGSKQDSAPNLLQILQEHPKGKEYKHIIEDFKQFPLLQDNKGNILSLVPIINSAHIGAVEVGDDTLFIECTGSNLEQLMLAMNIFACDCEDLGFSITRLTTRYPYPIVHKTMEQFSTNIPADNSQATHTLLATPLHFQERQSALLEDISALLGEKLDATRVQRALAKMGVPSKSISESQIEIEVPPYRNDFLHSVDIIEEVMIGLGMNTLEAESPKNYTIGRLSDIEYLSRKVISLMVGVGFQEMIYPYLGSKTDHIEKLYEKQEWQEVQNSMVQIANPLSTHYEFVRASILPNLLESERVSAHSPYPHRMCEIGKVARRNETENYSSSTLTVLGFLVADSHVGFTDINSILAAIFYYINIEDWHLEMLHDSRFIDGRSGKIVITRDGKTEEVGVFGELHPRVLEEFTITMPCVAGEVIIERLHNGT